MLYLGCHLSSSKGYLHMGREALRIGANTFQFFTRNPRGGSVKPLDVEDMRALGALMKERGFGPVVAHAPYTMNACAADPRLRTFAKETMLDDLKRLDHLPGNYYNFHPGSHVKQGVEVGVQYICEALNEVLWKEQQTTVLMETMAGKGSEIGGNFEELRMILEGVTLREHIGVCLDTCHVWEAGYDIVAELDNVLEQFDKVVGIDRLKAIHLNDSKNPREAHKDRHEKIGQGFIGTETLSAVINHPRLQNLPVCLETPNDIQGYGEEIALLRSLYRGD